MWPFEKIYIFRDPSSFFSKISFNVCDESLTDKFDEYTVTIKNKIIKDIPNYTFEIIDADPRKIKVLKITKS